MEIKIGNVVIVGDNADRLSRSGKFWRWLNTIYSSRLIKARQVSEEWSLWSRNGKLIFALFQIKYLDEEKSSVVFYRSDAVAVFLVLKDQDANKKYVVLVEQLRIPAGQVLLEIPAGSVENNDDFLETAVREIKEETTLDITQRDLRFLGSYFLSPGACNEKIALYSCELDVAGEEIKSLEGRWAGLKEEGENIRVRILPLEIFESLGTRDAKTMLAYELYLRQATR